MSQKTLPRHVAFIMDGNGRWAKERGKPRSYGHVAGYRALKNIVDYAFEKGIKTISFYAFSTENWSRPKDEVNRLMAILRGALRRETKNLIKRKIRLLVSGDYSMLNPKIVKEINDSIEKTKDFKPFTLNICFNYGSRAEIINAVKKIMEEGIKEIDESVISSHLYTADIPDPDLIIRTSGEQRLSNFLLWQSAYSEFYFTNVFWPDFDNEQLDLAVESYMNRDRRFGNTSTSKP